MFNLCCVYSDRERAARETFQPLAQHCLFFPAFLPFVQFETLCYFSQTVLSLYNSGNISQAFQWTMVLSRTVVLLLTLHC